MASTRFGVSMDEDLLKAFDEYIKNECYSNRSKAISNLVSNALKINNKQVDCSVCFVTISWDNDTNKFYSKITAVFNRYKDAIVFNQYCYMSGLKPFNNILLKGSEGHVQAFLSELKSFNSVSINVLFSENT